MILRTTKLNQMAVECNESQQMENNGKPNIAVETMVTDVTQKKEKEAVKCLLKATTQCAEKGVVESYTQTETLRNFKLMFSYRVAETVKTLTDTQYTDGEHYILYNVASFYVSKKRIFDELDVHTDLSSTFIQRWNLLDNTPVKSIGSIDEVYKKVRSVYKAGIKGYSVLNKKNSYRGDELRALYMFSAQFNWQPIILMQSGFAYNAARVWYAMEYVGFENIIVIGIIEHIVEKETVPVLCIRTRTETFYLMPRRVKHDNT